MPFTWLTLFPNFLVQTVDTASRTSIRVQALNQKRAAIAYGSFAYFFPDRYSWRTLREILHGASSDAKNFSRDGIATLAMSFATCAYAPSVPLLLAIMNPTAFASPRTVSTFYNPQNSVSPCYCAISQWWRWGESNPRPERRHPSVYACIAPLVSEGVCRRTGLSPAIRLFRHPAAGRRDSLQRGLLNYA